MHRCLFSHLLFSESLACFLSLILDNILPLFKYFFSVLSSYDIQITHILQLLILFHSTFCSLVCFFLSFFFSLCLLFWEVSIDFPSSSLNFFLAVSSLQMIPSKVFSISPKVSIFYFNFRFF